MLAPPSKIIGGGPSSYAYGFILLKPVLEGVARLNPARTHISKF